MFRLSLFKSYLVVSGLAMASGFAGTGVAMAREADVSEPIVAALPAKGLPNVVIHKGVVLGSGPQGLFSHDIATGEVTVRTRDGSQSRFRLEPSALPKRFPDLVWVGSEQTDDFGPRAKQACSREAEALGAAVAGVQASCSGSGSGSATCAAAMAFYHSAQGDYAMCIRQHLN